MSRLLLIFALTLPAFAHAGPADSSVEYSRDEHFVYAKLPLPLTLDDQQMALIRAGIPRIVRRLHELLPNNPRVGKADASLGDLASPSLAFESGLDRIVVDMQRNYGTIASAGLHLWNTSPSGIVGYIGVTGAGPKFALLNAGGTAVVGVVLMVKKVFRISVDVTKVDDIAEVFKANLDSGKIEEYPEVDGNWFLWGGVYLGLTSATTTAGKGFPIGGGFVFGTLAKPEDLSGWTVTGSWRPKTGWFGSNMIWKVTFLKNSDKSSWISNTMITGSYIAGESDQTIDPTVSLARLVDLQSFIHGGADILQSAGQKILGLNPPAAAIEKAPGGDR